MSAAVCRFPSVDAACEAAIAAIQSGIPMARVELLDEMQVRVCNAYSKLGFPEQPMLFLEFHGSEAGVAEQATPSARSPVSSVAVVLNGQKRPRTADGSGRCGTTFSGR